MKALVLPLLVALVLPVQAHHAGRAFVPLFQHAANADWHDTPHNYRLLYELAFAESSFRPDVQSHVGAIGLLQVLPATYREVQQQLGDLSDDLSDPADNIRAGSFYLRSQYNIWKADRPEEDRVKLGLASYNAGAGHLINAQRVAGGSPYWQDIAAKLNTQTGSHAPGTIKYANSIWERYQKAQAAGAKDVTVSRKREPVDIAKTAPPPPVAVEVVVQVPQGPLPGGISWEAVVAALFGLMQIKPRKDET